MKFDGRHLREVRLSRLLLSLLEALKSGAKLLFDLTPETSHLYL
jgi:hypothetical protein